jgi:hypothetical protein
VMKHLHDGSICEKESHSICAWGAEAGDRHVRRPTIAAIANSRSRGTCEHQVQVGSMIAC